MTDERDYDDDLHREEYYDLRLEEARGGYIGPIDREEALQALRSHHTGPVLIDYPERGFAGGEVRHFSGLVWEAGGEHSGVFVFTPETGHGEVPLGTAIAYANAFVLDLSYDPESYSEPHKPWTAERYTGGLDLHFPNAVVRLVFWHSFFHETEGGDIAPGIGPVEIEIRSEEEQG